MIVNINQCASMYDETLNVLKFSAVAQKVCNVLICLYLTHITINSPKIENSVIIHPHVILPATFIHLQIFNVT